MDESKPLLLMTGICGRIGTAAAAMFSKEFQVIGLDIIKPSDPLDGVEYLYADISSLESVKDALQQIKEKYGNHISSFIHLAAYYNFQGGGWDKYQKITVDGTTHLLKALSDFKLEQFVFSSTLLVFTPTRPGVKINENSPVDPKWEYPKSKIITEGIIHQMRGEASSVILRIAGIYDDECNSIPISQQISRIYEKSLESYFFPGDLDKGSAFLHMEDLVNALKRIVENRHVLGKEEMFILGEEKVMSYRLLQDEIGRLVHGKAHLTLQIPKFMGKLGAFLKGNLPFLKKSFIKTWMIDIADNHYELDIQKAKDSLGWEPKRSLKETLPLMIEKLIENPKVWYDKHGL